jgi:hypothetical protein
MNVTGLRAWLAPSASRDDIPCAIPAIHRNRFAIAIKLIS